MISQNMLFGLAYHERMNFILHPPACLKKNKFKLWTFAPPSGNKMFGLSIFAKKRKHARLFCRDLQKYIGSAIA